MTGDELFDFTNWLLNEHGIDARFSYEGDREVDGNKVNALLIEFMATTNPEKSCYSCIHTHVCNIFHKLLICIEAARPEEDGWSTWFDSFFFLFASRCEYHNRETQEG